jgi:menaquinone-dependent protoporphyrinogen oxidase
MPRLLILYGTTDGQTAKITRFLAREFQKLGNSVDIFDAATASPKPEEYDGIVVAASLHAGGFQRSVVHWVAEHREVLNRSEAVFLPVCLSVLQTDPRVIRELAGIINHFKSRTGWTPVETRLVAGAVLYTRYGWLKRLVMRRIVRKAGGGIDTSRDYEYTDWADLEAFARDFSAGHAGVPEPKPVPLESTTCEIDW